MSPETVPALTWVLAVALVVLAISIVVREAKNDKRLRGERARRERAEVRLKRAQAMLNSLPDVLLTIEADERVSELKLASRPGRSGPLPRFVDKRLADLFNAGALEPLRRARALAISTGEPQTVELQLRLFEEVRVYEARVAVLEASTVLALLRDVTERHVTAAALEEARRATETMARARTELLARVGHDLRNSVTGVVGTADLLLMRRDNLDEASRQYVEVIQRSGEHLVSLVGDVLDFTRLEQHKLSLRREPTDPCALVRDVIALFEADAARGGTTLALNIQEGMPERLLLDPMRTRQIVTNLVANAIKFTAPGRVQVELAMDQRELLITIADTGTGIAPEALPHVFDAFVQADSDSTRRAKGSGLGLAITRQLTEALDGNISVESTLGQGTTFRVRLPELRAGAAR